MVFLVGLATVVSTFLGGLFALRFHDKLHLILGFSAGALIGVAFFDLLPEALAVGETRFGSAGLTSLTALGFLVYLVADRLIVLHGHSDGHCESLAHRGWMGAGSLSLHSFLDGLAIGFAFQVSRAVGMVVTAAVLTHDFSDGINTVSMILRNGGSLPSALRWLSVDAVAPFLGVLATRFFTVPASSLSVLLAVFAGFFFYIGAGDLLPESHHAHPTKWTTLATCLGLGVLYVVVRLARV